jgi:hypothetical protein
MTAVLFLETMQQPEVRGRNIQRGEGFMAVNPEFYVL